MTATVAKQGAAANEAERSGELAGNSEAQKSSEAVVAKKAGNAAGAKGRRTKERSYGQIDSNRFQEWFLKASLGGFANTEADILADRVEGLLVEASHASWPEPDLREELAIAIRSFADAQS